MKLDLIIPHYREPWSVCRYLFDTLASQRGIPFESIRVLLVNDGDSILFGSMENAMLELAAYPFTVDYIVKDHEGVSAARNAGLDASDADFVMFCDCDDGFLNNYALHLIFSAMQEGFDMCMANFVEETWDRDGNPKIVTHNEDLTFVHGKVYRRQFLVYNGIRFDPAMTVHEDGYFNMLAYSVLQFVGGNMKKLSTPIYLWRWNKDSVVRSDREDFVLKTYRDVMKARVGICRVQKQRGMDKFYQASVCMTVLNSYYDFQKPRYHLPKNREHLKNAEKAFRGYWKEFGSTFNELTNAYIAEVAVTARGNAVKNGMLMEQETLKDFLKRMGKA